MHCSKCLAVQKQTFERNSLSSSYNYTPVKKGGINHNLQTDNSCSTVQRCAVQWYRHYYPDTFKRLSVSCTQGSRKFETVQKKKIMFIHSKRELKTK